MNGWMEGLNFRIKRVKGSDWVHVWKMEEVGMKKKSTRGYKRAQKGTKGHEWARIDSSGFHSDTACDSGTEGTEGHRTVHNG